VQWNRPAAPWWPEAGVTAGLLLVSVPTSLWLRPQVIGGLVWILVASAGIEPANPLAWVMFVSLFCFVVTTVWFFLFLFGANQGSIWPSLVRHAPPPPCAWRPPSCSDACPPPLQDVGYHFLAAVLYLSAAVPLAFITLLYGQVINALGGSTLIPFDVLKVYRLEIAAVVIHTHTQQQQHNNNTTPGLGQLSRRHLVFLQAINRKLPYLNHL